jgi:mannose-1-phosphate guanylyltransferase
MDWSDVGSWSSIWSTLPNDAEHNLLKGDVLAVDTRNSLIWSGSDVRIATLGLENMVIVATSDIILIAPMDRANEATALLAKSIRDAGDERGSG